MKMSLKFKSGLVILVFTLFLSVLIISISYYSYKQSVNQHYSKLTFALAKSTASTLDARKFKIVADEVLKTYRQICAENGRVPENLTKEEEKEYYSRFLYITKMPEYKDLMKFLQELREYNDAESLYLGYIDLETFKDIYIVDASRSEPCPPGHFDDTRSENIAAMRGGTFTFPAYITNTPEYGWLCSASAQIKDEDGKGIGVALADISMNKTKKDIRDFIVSEILITAVFVFLLAYIVLRLINKFLIVPINRLSFVSGSLVAQMQEQGRIEETQFEKLNIKTGDEVENLASAVKKMGVDLNKYVQELTIITTEKERIGAELDIATDIQSSMLPCIFPAFPERPEFDIYAQMTPAKEVGGDFYDFFMVDDRHIAIVMADVSGKGVPAALFMVIAKTLIKDHTVSEADLGEIFTKVNNILCESNSEGLFVTAFEGVLDLVSGEFQFVNAGHEIPYVSKGGGEFEPYKIKPGFVLAGMEDMRYTAGSVTLEPGDKIFQYTDGVTEAVDSENELYGAHRLNSVLNRSRQKTPCEIINDVKLNIDAFVGEADQFDDITMLCLEYKIKMKPEGK